VFVCLQYGEFEWSKVLQGNILSAFYVGYILTQIPGGWLANKFGGKHVMGTGLLIGIVCTMVTPMAARIHPYLLIFVRIVMGIGMVSRLCFSSSFARGICQGRCSEYSGLLFCLRIRNYLFKLNAKVLLRQKKKRTISFVPMQ